MTRLRVVGWLAFAGLLIAAAYSTAESVSEVSTIAAERAALID